MQRAYLAAMRSAMLLPLFLILAPACTGLAAGDLVSTEGEDEKTASSAVFPEKDNNAAAKEQGGSEGDDEAICDGHDVCPGLEEQATDAYFSEKSCTSETGRECSMLEHKKCQADVWCPKQEPECRAMPTCAGGEDTYKAKADCTDVGHNVGCHAVTVCNATVWCGRRSFVETCTAVPSCANGETEFKTADDCKDAGGTNCHDVTVCKATIYCGVVKKKK